MKHWRGSWTVLARSPGGISVLPEHGDSFEVLDEILSGLEEEGYELAPSFVFCDPFGFSVPGSTLKRLMQFRGVELFVNVIWRELDMAMAQGRSGQITLGMQDRLDSIFDGEDWLGEVDADNIDDRAEQCANLFRKMVGADWATHIRMEDRGRTRYFLLHLSNHDAGRDLMKECIWKVCPDGGYYARKSDDPKQSVLITPEPDYQPLEAWLRSQLEIYPRRWQELHDLVREEVWLNKHVNHIVRRWRKEKIVEGTDYDRTFAPKNDPLLTLLD